MQVVVALASQSHKSLSYHVGGGGSGLTEQKVPLLPRPQETLRGRCGRDQALRRIPVQAGWEGPGESKGAEVERNYPI